MAEKKPKIPARQQDPARRRQNRPPGAEGSSLAALLLDLDQRYPGIRFGMIDEQERMRAHIRFFVNGEQVFDLRQPLRGSDEVAIVQAPSGG